MTCKEWNNMIEEKFGCIEYCSSCSVYLDRIEELEDELDVAIGIIEDAGVDYEEIKRLRNE